MWNNRYARPDRPNTYAVRLFTGVERTAYWTGETWVQNQDCKTTNRTRGDRQLLKLLRGWKDIDEST
ncbi:hypothetical protein B0G84_9076 [Paraburkholderia sp. BL8N3]|nr:hypothetical protein [Paraburkholderia sp. BL8N3]TCK31960.1 hypothetical protein B0G84_9076 [Paraburkholderia sp. BL8N3]